MEASVARFACGTCEGWQFQWGRFTVSRIDAHFGVGHISGGTNGQGELQSAVAVLFKIGRKWQTLELGQADVGCHQMPKVVRRDLGLTCSRTPEPPPRLTWFQGGEIVEYSAEGRAISRTYGEARR